jgi:polysaccharide biosynthesis/export protein
MKLKVLVSIILMTLTILSCVNTRKLTYIQPNLTGKDSIRTFTPVSYKIMPFDNLFIRVMTPDPKLADMFNTIPATVTGLSMTEQSADMLSYFVDGNGNIRLPYAGQINVAGRTLDTVTVEIENILKSYVADAAVTIKLVNNYVSLLGEFKQPGKYPIYKERMTIFQALAMGGDLGDFGDRQSIQVIRQTNDGPLIKEFTLTDQSILHSEFYYVMPNDVIYAKPMKGRFFHMNEFPYNLVLGTLTTFILLWNVIK